MNINDIKNTSFEDISIELGSMLQEITLNSKPRILCCAILSSEDETALLVQTSKKRGALDSVALTLMTISEQSFLSSEHSETLHKIAKELNDGYKK